MKMVSCDLKVVHLAQMPLDIHEHKRIGLYTDRMKELKRNFLAIQLSHARSHASLHGGTEPRKVARRASNTGTSDEVNSRTGQRLGEYRARTFNVQTPLEPLAGFPGFLAGLEVLELTRSVNVTHGGEVGYGGLPTRRADR